MSSFKVDFDAMPWQDVRPGVRHKVLSFAAGDGLFIPPGPAAAHRGHLITPGTRLIMVEEVAEPSSSEPA